MTIGRKLLIRPLVTVGLDAQILPADVVRRQVGIDGYLQLDLSRHLDRFTVEFGHRLVDHLAVQVIAHRRDVPALAGAQQVAGAANVKVVAGEREAGAERIERLQHL